MSIHVADSGVTEPRQQWPERLSLSFIWDINCAFNLRNSSQERKRLKLKSKQRSSVYFDVRLFEQRLKLYLLGQKTSLGSVQKQCKAMQREAILRIDYREKYTILTLNV